MTLTDIEEYSFRLNNVLDCTIYNHITVGNVTLQKAVLSTVKIFEVGFEFGLVGVHRTTKPLTGLTLKQRGDRNGF